MTTNDLLEYEIYPRLMKDPSKILEDFPGFKEEGNASLANCPACGDTGRHFIMYKNSKPIGFCFKCSYKKNYWDFIQETKNLSQQETLLELARLAEVPLPKDHKIDLQEIARRQKKADELEDFLMICQEELKKSSEAQKYLKDRGFTLPEALSLGVGFYSSRVAINPGVRELRGLLSEKWEKRIVGLWRDRAGRPITAWGRDITETRKPKYNYLYDEPKYSPFGLEKGYHSRVIAVEGIIDALSLWKWGFKGIIALGGAFLSGNHIEALLKAKVKDITLNLDNNDSGYKGIAQAIDKLEEAGIKTYVIEPSLMGVKDPDDYIRKEGKDAYNALLEKAQRGVEWKIERLVKEHDIKTAKGKDAALDEGIELINKIQDPVVCGYGIEKLASSLSKTEAAIAEVCIATEEKNRLEKLKKEYNNLLDKARKGEINSPTLVEKIRELEVQTGKVVISSLLDFIDEKRANDEARPEGYLGYKLRKFSKFCENIDGVQTGLYLIAGDTSKGKTAFLVNLFLDILETNPETHGLFVTLDDDIDTIFYRMLAVKSGLEINKTQKPKGLRGEEIGALNKAYNAIRTLADDRFRMKDISIIDNIKTLENYIRTIQKKEEHLFVAIDDIYNLNVAKESDSLRGENIERANKIKALVSIYNIPIICTGEVRKTKSRGGSQEEAPSINDLMETGKFAYNANLVLLLHPEGEPDKDEITLNCQYAKNKLRYYGGTEKLIFKPKISTITEKPFSPGYVE